MFDNLSRVKLICHFTFTINKTLHNISMLILFYILIRQTKCYRKLDSFSMPFTYVSIIFQISLYPDYESTLNWLNGFTGTKWLCILCDGTYSVAVVGNSQGTYLKLHNSANLRTQWKKRTEVENRRNKNYVSLRGTFSFKLLFEGISFNTNFTKLQKIKRRMDKKNMAGNLWV